MTILSLTLGWRSTLFIFSIPALAAGLIVIWYLSEDKKTRKIIVEKDVDESHLKSDIAVLIKTRGVLPILLTQALLSGGLDIGTLTTYTPIFLASFLGMDAYERGMVYTVGLLGGVIGPILLGKYAGCIGYVKMAATSTFISSILIYSLVFYKPGASNILLALHLFAIMFVSFSLPTLLQSYLVKVTSGYNRDLSVGIFFTMGFIFNSSLFTKNVVAVII